MVLSKRILLIRILFFQYYAQDASKACLLARPAPSSFAEIRILHVLFLKRPTLKSSLKIQQTPCFSE